MDELLVQKWAHLLQIQERQIEMLQRVIQRLEDTEARELKPDADRRSH
jgi:hypothetical protein